MKKSQVALEFLMTYGWAILVTLAAVSTLAYMGITNSRTLVSKCVFSNGLSCLGSQINTTNATVVLQNSLGQTIYLTSANITGSTVACKLTPTGACAAECTIRVDCPTSSFGFTDVGKLKMNIYYTKVSGGFNQISQGDVYKKLD